MSEEYSLAFERRGRVPERQKSGQQQKVSEEGRLTNCQVQRKRQVKRAKKTSKCVTFTNY